MKKWLLLAFSFLVARYSSALRAPMINIIEQASSMTRRLVLVAVFSLVAATMTTAGMILSIDRFFTRYDSVGSVGFNGGVAGGLIIAFVGIAIFAIIYNLKHKSTPRPTGSPIEEAVALLVRDYAEERKLRRQRTREPLRGVPKIPEDFQEDTEEVRPFAFKQRPKMKRTSSDVI